MRPPRASGPEAGATSAVMARKLLTASHDHRRSSEWGLWPARSTISSRAIRDARRDLGLVLGREEEVVATGDDQRGSPDLTEPIHDAPAREQVPTSEDERLAAEHRPPLAVYEVTRHDPEEREAPADGSRRRPKRNIEDCALLGATCPLKKRRTSRTILGLYPRRARSSAALCCGHHASPPVSSRMSCETRLGIPEGVLERDRAAEGVAEDGPPLEAEPLAERVGVGGQVLPRHRLDRRAARATVTAMVVEDEGELRRRAARTDSASSGRLPARRA